MTVTRPVLRYLGGKFRLAPWIIAHFPPHRVYVEPFGGAASVLLRKPRSEGEVYNDLSGELVSMFQILREPQSAAQLIAGVAMTAFARAEYDLAFEPASDAVEAARRLIVRSYMGHGSSSAVAQRSTGFRASLVNRGGVLPAGDWATLPPALAAVHDRLQRVVIERRPALQLLERYDDEAALFYLDPPYVPETRSQKRRGGSAFHAYAHELNREDHQELLATARDLAGMVVISGYPSSLYDAELRGWERVERAAHADGAHDRTEVLWINARAAARLRAAGGAFVTGDLLEIAA